MADENRSIGTVLGGYWANLMSSFFEGLYDNKILLLIPFAAGVALAIMLKIF